MNATTIKAARAGLDWTQKDLAAQAGIHPKSVAYWERTTGAIPPQPDAGAVPRIKEALARHGVIIDGNTVRFLKAGNA